MSSKYHAGLLLAIQEAGGQGPLAFICGCTRQNIHQAVTAGRGLPARYAIKVEKELGISRHMTRPDIFGEIERPKRRRRA